VTRPVGGGFAGGRALYRSAEALRGSYCANNERGETIVKMARAPETVEANGHRPTSEDFSDDAGPKAVIRRPPARGPDVILLETSGSPAITPEPKTRLRAVVPKRRGQNPSSCQIRARTGRARFRSSSRPRSVAAAASPASHALDAMRARERPALVDSREALGPEYGAHFSLVFLGACQAALTAPVDSA